MSGPSETGSSTLDLFWPTDDVCGSDDDAWDPDAPAVPAEDDPRPLLQIRRTLDPVGVRLVGEADASNRDAVAAALAGLVEEASHGMPVAVDLSELRFADGATVHLLVRTALAAVGRVRLTGCSAALARLLDLISGGVLAPDVVQRDA